MNKLMRREARDVWDDLMERIDLSGGYETFIDPNAIEKLVNDNEKLRIENNAYKEYLSGKHDSEFLKRYKDREVTKEELSNLADNMPLTDYLKRTKTSE